MLTRDVLRLAQPGARQFTPPLGFGILSAFSAVALLATSGYLIARAAEEPPILYLSIAIVGVRGFALARATFRYLDRLAGHDAAFRALARLRVSIYERLVPLAPDGLASTRRGDLLARLVHDVDDLQNLPLRVVQPVLTALLVAALAVVGVWLLLPAAAVALAVALLLALFAGTAVDSLIAARTDRALAPLRGSFTDQTLDIIGTLDVLTAFGATDAALARLAETDARLTRSATRGAVAAGVTAAIVSLLAGLATVAALVTGIPALGVAGGAGLALGSVALQGPVLAVLALVPIATFEVFAAVPLAAGAWRRVHSSATRVASALPDTLPAEIPQSTGAHPAPALPAASPTEAFRDSASRIRTPMPHAAPSSRVPVIRLERVSAWWPALGDQVEAGAPAGADARAVSDPVVGGAADVRPGGCAGVAQEPGPVGSDALVDRAGGGGGAGAGGGAAAGAGGGGVQGVAALSDVSVCVRPGERLLVEGPSGSGKTTLAHVLVRFLEHRGDYSIDGVDVHTLQPEAVRQTIGLCEQTPYIFDANLRQNLLFARETASDDELLGVLDRVGLTDWASERGGLSARLGQHGSLVSGGEAQRIALARVLLADFPVVVFDEPTANVDGPRADALLRDLLTAAGPERSVMLISHTEVPPELVTQRLRLG